MSSVVYRSSSDQRPFQILGNFRDSKATLPPCDKMCNNGRNGQMNQRRYASTCSQIDFLDARLRIRYMPMERVELAHHHTVQQASEDRQGFPVPCCVNHERAMREPRLVGYPYRHATDGVVVGIEVPVYQLSERL